MIVCTRGQRGRKKLCVRCKQVAEFLCDAPRDSTLTTFVDDEGKGRCSAPLCAAHKHDGTEDRCYCWHHRKHEQE